MLVEGATLSPAYKASLAHISEREGEALTAYAGGGGDASPGK
ncbi:MAG: hypothetical protein A4E58_02907 [Syntrophorhabdus sp. PtaB.Bin006]|nr:MAG: hypothetical protein A4E58_02907 [Syntrophorhabdus sp. PtaB.Bin006]